MPGTTGAVDFVFSGFLKDAGIDVTKVPYKDGVQALNDLAEGRIQIYGAAYAIMRPQVEAGEGEGARADEQGTRAVAAECSDSG